ncbi:hypothetical protein BMH32_04715 [Leucobacter sp. OLJS4]|uniref:hypothetical protein n=1 Tax=unclassified Leucobacter TaxID=2621730 RepID=UPI000C19A6D8|nr:MULTISPECIES: hypothetical protein [unclassified Leucobacter]PIJ06798.1 hypothetical protein BMH30_14265 [Leucobacter sp. OLES1]PII81557.1 hypothetical protein BMH25_13605 [Leucobacter sp. OLCALW19]PII86229.1 hypothetical protein BMH26_14025 [Leucobacter sp. OLTLW20]PII90124.1 hypothetical protein BMH27_12190 [Leucobacter sp. OLAS13]PII97157.1 hypothetical protein BMH29_12875 [Leucobacter sp. OLDS2]
MSVEVAAITAFGVVVAALLTYVTAAQGRMQRDLGAAEQTNRALWAYTRRLIDQVYRLGGQPADPPTYVDKLYREDSTP